MGFVAQKKIQVVQEPSEVKAPQVSKDFDLFATTKKPVKKEAAKPVPQIKKVEEVKVQKPVVEEVKVVEPPKKVEPVKVEEKKVESPAKPPPAAQKPKKEVLSIKKVKCTPYQDQKPGTSGLRKKVKVFKQEHYLENFVQSIFNALPKEEYVGKALVVSGDGRYHNDVATQTIIQIAISNGVSEIYIGQHCLLSTPAVSAMIRKLNKDNKAGYCFGGIVLSASHNPGGPDEDFGIKFNGENGGPSLEGVTEEIFNQSKIIKEYTMLEGYKPIDTDLIGDHLLPELEGAPKMERMVYVVDNSDQYV